MIYSCPTTGEYFTTDGVHINDTPHANPNSIMNEGSAAGAGNRFLGFTSEDIWAMHRVHWQEKPNNIQVTGTARILVGGDSNVMLSTGTTPQSDGNYVFRSWNGTQWDNLTQASHGRGIKMALTTGGQYYYITADKKIYKGGIFPAPQLLPGEAIDIAANSSGELFIVSNTYYNSEGNKVMKWNGVGWDDYLPLTGAKKIALPAGPNALPYIVKNSGSVHYLNTFNNVWFSMGAGINAISIATSNYMKDISGLPILYIIDGALPTSDQFQIRRWTGHDWLTLPGGGTTVAVGTDGRPWHTNTSNFIYRSDKF